MVEHIEGDLFWRRLGKLMINVVKARWNLINIFMKYYFEPYAIYMVNMAEWLAEDVEGNFGYLTESFGKMDSGEYLWFYWGWAERVVTSYFVCSSESSEILLFRFYNYGLSMFGYFEPSFRLFESQSLCQLFDFCQKEGENYENLNEKIESSKVKEAMVEVSAYVQQIKQAIICNNEQAWKTYWKYVLF